MDQGVNQPNPMGGEVSSNPMQDSPVSGPNLSQDMPPVQPVSQAHPASKIDLPQEAPPTQPASQVFPVNQEPVSSSAGTMSPANSQPSTETTPSTSPPDITSVVTTSSGDKKSKKTLWILLGILLFLAISVGGYFVYTGLSEKQSDPDQSLTNLPSPVLLPTNVPTLVPTKAPLLKATGNATLSLCEKLQNEATQSAHQTDFCSGEFCTSIETQEECLEVDVVATSGGVLSTKKSSDGVGDCVWDALASGFGSKCKVKYE